MIAGMTVRPRLEDMELPAGPGSLLRITVDDEGRGEFFGPDGPWLGQGYTVEVNGDRWRAILETVRAGYPGSEATFRVEGRYSEEGLAGP